MSHELELRRLAEARFDGVVDLRRDLHAHPELSFAETRTTAVLRERMSAAGWSELPCPTATGAVFELHGGRPGRSVLLRADIDALPLREEVEVAFASRRDGVMHACGHDGHAAMLVGAAQALSARAEDLPGRYVCVFQPAEEVISGARRMLDGGLLETVRCDVVLSLHLAAMLRSGLVGHRTGLAMSAAQQWRVELGGRGGHGAMRDATGNVVVAAALLAGRAPEVVAGLEHEGTPCVCSVGMLHAGTALNVVPRQASVEGSLRTWSTGQHDAAVARLAALADEVAAEIGVAAALQLPARCPAVVNDAAVTAGFAAAAARELGAGNVAEMPLMAPSDDVAELLLRLPGTYFFVGAQPGAALPPQHHAPDFTIDEAALGTGTLALLAGAVALAADEHGG